MDLGLATIGAAGIGAVSSALGARSANKKAQALATQQMNFQERMRDTSYQSAVRDMRAAGLNPLLAYQQGGASSPSGAMAPVKNVMEGAPAAANSALAAKLAKYTLAQEQTKLYNLDAENRLLTLQEIHTGYQIRMSEIQENLLRASSYGQLYKYQYEKENPTLMKAERALQGAGNSAFSLMKNFPTFKLLKGPKK